jgi:hypothetical protein
VELRDTTVRVQGQERARSVLVSFAGMHGLLTATAGGAGHAEAARADLGHRHRVVQGRAAPLGCRHRAWPRACFLSLSLCRLPMVPCWGLTPLHTAPAVRHTRAADAAAQQDRERDPAVLRRRGARQRVRVGCCVGEGVSHPPLLHRIVYFGDGMGEVGMWDMRKGRVHGKLKVCLLAVVLQCCGVLSCVLGRGRCCPGHCAAPDAAVRGGDRA